MAAALVLLIAPAAEGASTPSGTLRADAEESVLRLQDLAPGYTIGGDSGCETFRPTGIEALRALDRWIAENRPAGCEFEYRRRFLVPGFGPAPPWVQAETIDTPSADAAAKGFGIYSRLIPRLTGRQADRTVPIAAGGPPPPSSTSNRAPGESSRSRCSFGVTAACLPPSK